MQGVLPKTISSSNHLQLARFEGIDIFVCLTLALYSIFVFQSVHTRPIEGNSQPLLPSSMLTTFPYLIVIF